MNTPQLLLWAALTLILSTWIATAKAASERLLFDFGTSAQQPEWRVVNDDVMGGITSSRFRVLADKSATFSGRVSLENNGGFASVRSPSRDMDLSRFDGIKVRVLGDGKQYKFTIRTQEGFNGPHYQTEFKTINGQWKEHVLRWKQFMPTFRGKMLSDAAPLRAAQIKSVGFLIADKQAGPFRLEIAWIKAITLP